MSLINQALRKAQQQRTPTRPATAANNVGTPPSSYSTANTSQPGLLIGLVAGFALLIGLVVGLTIVVLRKDPAPSVQQTTTLPAAPTAQTVQNPVAQPATQPLVAPSSAPAVTLPISQEKPSVLNELRLARQAAEAKAAADAASAQKAEAEALAAKIKAEAIAAAKPSQDIIKWLSQAKVSGVRLSAERGSKVILNNKAYTTGDTVNLGLGLKVLIIQEQRILFIDANGKKYLKQI